jgi:CHASE3 domain sensor protein
VKARMDTLSPLIEMGPEQAAAVGHAMRDPTNRQIMRLARAKMAEFRGMELKLLRDHEKTAEKVSKHNYALAVGIVIVAFVLGALSIALAQFGYGTRPKA